MNYSIGFILLFYSYLFILGLLGIRFSARKRIYLLFFQIIGVSIFFGLRNINVGVDTINYYNIYISQAKYIDFGFSLFNQSLFFLIGDNYRIYFFVISFVTSLNLGLIYLITIKKENKYLNIAFSSIFIFPYSILMFINIIRQGLAISFILLGMVLFLKLKKHYLIKFLLFIVGFSLHYSMIFPVLFFFLSLKLMLKEKTIIITSLLFVILSYLGLIQSLLVNFPILVLRNRFLNVVDIGIGVNLILRYTFYFLLYLISIYIYSKVNNLRNHFLVKTIGVFILISSLLFFSDLISSRYLLSIDFLIPIIYIGTITLIKEKFFIKFILFLIYVLILVITLSSYSIQLNFGF